MKREVLCVTWLATLSFDHASARGQSGTNICYRVVISLIFFGKATSCAEMAAIRIGEQDAVVGYKKNNVLPDKCCYLGHHQDLNKRLRGLFLYQAIPVGQVLWGNTNYLRPVFDQERCMTA